MRAPALAGRPAWARDRVGFEVQGNGEELRGESRGEAFEQQAQEDVRFYPDHMRTEETELLPAAETLLSQAEWAELEAAFYRRPRSARGRSA